MKKLQEEESCKRLKNKVALITGAGLGIGRSTALRFAREGASVVVADINEQAARTTAEDIGKAGGTATAVCADVTQEKQVKNMLSWAVRCYGRLDILVNNAGIGASGDVVELPESEWQRVFDVNLKGVYLGCKYAIPEMIRSGSGSIVNIASMWAFVGGSACCAYSTSKGGVVALSKNTALRYAAEGIRINCVCPGHVETALTFTLKDPQIKEALIKKYPIGRFGEPEEIANAVLFLASDEASFITGTELIVDGGYTAQ